MYLARNQEILQSLAKRKAVIKTSGKDNKPELVCKYPADVKHTVYHNSPIEQETCLGFYSVKPYETKPTAAIVRTDIILITSPTLKKVNILPTRVGIEFDYSQLFFESFCIPDHVLDFFLSCFVLVSDSASAGHPYSLFLADFTKYFLV